MQHVDEAILNAYLDGELEGQGEGSGQRGAGRSHLPGLGTGTEERGAETVGDIEAHLASCAECSALLQEVKRVRDRASEILSSSTPVDLEIPPFEEIRARSAARSSGSRVMQLSRIKKLAWAATIVLAVAVGWYARDAVIVERAEQFVAAPASDVEALRETDQPGARFDSVEADEDAQPAMRLAAEPSETQPAATPVEGAAEGRQSGARRNVEAEEAARTEAGAGLPSRAKAEPELDVTVLAEEQVARRQRMAEAPPVVAQQVAAEPSAAVGGVAVGEVLLLEDSQWIEATEVDARNALGGDVPTVTDLPVIDYAVLLVQGRDVVRVRQRLDDEEVLELVIARGVPLERAELARRDELAMNEAKDAAADAVGAVTVRIGEYEVVLRGAVPTDSLRALGRKVR